MAFFKLRDRDARANEARKTRASAPPAESVEAMRRRARHRLVGAAVLVLIGVVCFPLLFDTQPRPVPVDIPIDIPDRNKVRPLPVPPPATTSQATPPAAGSGSANPPAAASAGKAAGSSGGMITELADGTELAAPAPEAPPAETRPSAKVEPAPAPKAVPDNKAAEARAAAEAKARNEAAAKAAREAKNEHKPDPRSDAKVAKSEESARARALLEGKKPAKEPPVAAADDAGRFIVQVGAFAEADKAREVRQRLERAGLKAFTSTVKTGDGDRTRVRLGPFASRAEAERAAGKVKGLSLSAAVLTL